MSALGNSAVIGGTSAGLHILGEIDYSSRPEPTGTPNDGITSIEALSNPTSPLLTFNHEVRTDLLQVVLDENEDNPRTKDLLDGVSYLSGVITDTHFVQRDRMGRFMTFMAWTGLNGLAVDAASAVLVETQDTRVHAPKALSINKALNEDYGDPTKPKERYDNVEFVGAAGSAIVIGEGHRSDIGGVAYFGVVTESTKTVGSPFSGRGTVRMFTLESGRFEFADGWWDGGTAYNIVVIDGVLRAYDDDGNLVDVYSGQRSTI
jgi:hypothetical protein